MLLLAGDTATPVTATVAVVTVITDVAVYPPSAVVTVIVAVPAAIPDTTPAVLIDATAVLDEAHVTDVLVAPDGAIVAVSVCVLPIATEAVVGLTLTPVTGVGWLLYQVLFSYQPFVPPRYRLPVWLLPSLNMRLSDVMLVKV
jgi:hypothetical protein